MAKDWIYAKMSQDAAAAGGPEKWLELIKNEAFSNGVAKGAGEMKGKMAPWIAVAAGIGVGGTLLVQKINEWVVNRKEEKLRSAELAAEAEALLLSQLQSESPTSEQEETTDIKDE